MVKPLYKCSAVAERPSDLKGGSMSKPIKITVKLGR